MSFDIFCKFLISVESHGSEKPDKETQVHLIMEDKAISGDQIFQKSLMLLLMHLAVDVENNIDQNSVSYILLTNC